MRTRCLLVVCLCATSAVAAPTAQMSIARAGHTATRLGDGRVAVIGGQPEPGDDASASVEVWDPTKQRWSFVSAMSTGRWGHSSVLLQDGRLLVAGGVTSAGEALASAEIYDPKTNRWKATTAMINARRDHTATLLGDGRVLVAGGSTGGDTSEWLATLEIWDPSTGSWSAAGKLAKPRSGHTATQVGGLDVLFIGGSTGSTTLATAEVWKNGRVSPAGTMSAGRQGHTASLLTDFRVFVAGGDAGGTAEIWDSNAKTFAYSGKLRAARKAHSAAILDDGTIVLIGGQSSKGDIAAIETWHPKKAFHDAGTLAVARATHTATVIAGTKVLVVGGIGGGRTQKTAELWSPETATPAVAGDRYHSAKFSFSVLAPAGFALREQTPDKMTAVGAVDGEPAMVLATVVEAPSGQRFTRDLEDVAGDQFIAATKGTSVSKSWRTTTGITRRAFVYDTTKPLLRWELVLLPLGGRMILALFATTPKAFTKTEAIRTKFFDEVSWDPGLGVPAAGLPAKIDKDKLVRAERIGPLAMGLTDADVIKAFGKPERKSREEEEGATGDFTQQWEYPRQGITLVMSRATKGKGKQAASMITIRAPSKLKTSFGIAIGSRRTDVQKAYGPYTETDEPESFLAGSEYGGVLFALETGRVTSISIGAFAE